MDFYPSLTTGIKAKQPFINMMNEQNIESNLVPISMVKFHTNSNTRTQYQIIRQQFPLAEAITIHKSQGQTFDCVCVDFRKAKRMTRPMTYVAFSRVTSLAGLYILGSFKPTKPPNAK